MFTVRGLSNLLGIYCESDGWDGVCFAGDEPARGADETEGYWVPGIFDRGARPCHADCGGNGGKVLVHVGGRRVDAIWNTRGEMISPYVINNTMVGYYELKQYQFIQENATHYTLRLNTKGKPLSKEAELINRIKEYVGQDAVIQLEYVSEIPLLSSGKRKQVVCHYKNSPNCHQQLI